MVSLVVVGRLAPKQQIAHAPANEIGMATVLVNRWMFSFSSQRQFGLGINAWALIMLVLLLRSKRIVPPAGEPTPASPEKDVAIA